MTFIRIVVSVACYYTAAILTEGLRQISNLLLAATTSIEIHQFWMEWGFPRIMLTWPKSVSWTVQEDLGEVMFYVGSLLIAWVGFVLTRRTAGWFRLLSFYVLFYSTQTISFRLLMFISWAEGPTGRVVSKYFAEDDPFVFVIRLGSTAVVAWLVIVSNRSAFRPLLEGSGNLWKRLGIFAQYLLFPVAVVSWILRSRFLTTWTVLSTTNYTIAMVLACYVGLLAIVEIPSNWRRGAAGRPGWN